MNYRHHNWAELSHEEYLRIHLEKIGVSEDKIEMIVEEFAQLNENNIKKGDQ